MSTLLISPPACLAHQKPMVQPERPERGRAIEQAWEAERFQSLAREQAPRAADEIVALAHPMEYVEAIRRASPANGLVRLDADTSMSPGSLEAALRAVGGVTPAGGPGVNRKDAKAFLALPPP